MKLLQNKRVIVSIQKENILIYISESINFLRRYDLEHDDIEAIWIQINNEKSKPFVLRFTYRPPQCNND